MQIKSENILKVIRNLEKVLPTAKAECNLSMGEPSVHFCGTIACHGGWYAKAVFNPLKLILPSVDYTTGARRMAKDLGFKEIRHLTTWAHGHTRIWGNRWGPSMFSDRIAFYHQVKRPSGALTLNDIVDHWIEVYKRVKAQEEASVKPKAPEYEDITKEIACLPLHLQQDMVDVKVKELV